MAEANIAEMKSRARAAMEMAYCPYSKFKVGVCIYAEIGDPMFISGCNVENASYSLCICAERVALSKAISDGYVEFEAMAVATDSSPPASPCGACRQFINELCRPEMPIIMLGRNNEEVTMTVKELLPYAFVPQQLQNSIKSAPETTKPSNLGLGPAVG